MIQIRSVKSSWSLRSANEGCRPELPCPVVPGQNLPGQGLSSFLLLITGVKLTWYKNRLFKVIPSGVKLTRYKSCHFKVIPSGQGLQRWLNSKEDWLLFQARV